MAKHCHMKERVSDQKEQRQVWACPDTFQDTDIFVTPFIGKNMPVPPLFCQKDHPGTRTSIFFCHYPATRLSHAIPKEQIVRVLVKVNE